MGWRAVWKHQLRWARTIRVCQPVPYFFSILSNAGFWAIVWLLIGFATTTAYFQSLGNGAMSGMIEWGPGVVWGALLLVARVIIARNLQHRLTHSGNIAPFWLVPIKDLLQFAIWLCAFAGNTIEWRGQKFRLRRDGKLIKPGT
jgi:ceramide glucosyltransferase